MASVTSTPMTLPARPTLRAARRLSIPAPEPRSSTVWPGVISPRPSGLPTPAKDSVTVGGRASISAASYPSLFALSGPIENGCFSCGSRATLTNRSSILALI